MRTGRPVAPLKISPEERKALQALALGHDRRMAARAAAILASADGVSNKDVAARTRMTNQTVGKWRARFRVRGLAGLSDDPRPGAPRRITDEQVATVLRMTAEPSPSGASWTTRSLAHAVGLTQTAVSRIWRSHGVRPAVRDGGEPAAQTPAAPPRTLAYPRAVADTDGSARPSSPLDAMNKLLHDAQALRGSGPAETDPLLSMAIDAIEQALQKHREPVRSTQARAQIALRQARHLLAQAEAVAQETDRLAHNVATSKAVVAAIRTEAEKLLVRAAAAPAPRRCPSCGNPYTLRFKVRGAGGDEITARMKCPRPRCGKPIRVNVPSTAEDVRLEKATAS